MNNKGEFSYERKRFDKQGNIDYEMCVEFRKRIVGYGDVGKAERRIRLGCKTFYAPYISCGYGGKRIYNARKEGETFLY